MNSARPHLMCFVFYHLIEICILEESKSNKSLLIRKCCQDGKQLSLESNLNSCVDYLGYYGYSTDHMKKSPISVLIKDSGDFPWWLNSDVKLLSSTTFTYVDSFLARQDPTKYIEYGVKQPCNAFMTKIIDSDSDDYDLFDNGTLVYFPDAPNYHRNASFSPAFYCADRVRINETEARFVFLLCPCSRMPCVRKCCPPHKMLSISDRRWDIKPHCVVNEDGTDWAPSFHGDTLKRLDAVEEGAIMYTNIYDFPACDKDQQPTVLNPVPVALPLRLWVLRNGSAIAQHFGRGKPFAPQHYCVDASVFQGSVRVLNAVMCNSYASDVAPDVDGQFYGALFVIGSVFLSATLLVFYLLPELRSSAHSKSLMAHTASFLVAYVALAVGQLRPRTSYGPCVTLAFIIQWSILAAFFWLNVMCIDISWTFSGFRALQGSLRDRDHKKFFYYSLYAWGSPTIISTITGVMEFMEEVSSYVIRPNFGIRACWFKEKIATFAYFYGPMAALLFGNLFLFAFTAVKIMIARRDTAILHEHGQQDTQRFVLYTKLFVLMGLTWITEIISWAHGSTLILWYVTDFINLLRAVFIFVIFCCKPKVFVLLRQRMRELSPCWYLEIIPSNSRTNESCQSNTSTHKTDIFLTQVNGRKTSNTVL